MQFAYLPSCLPLSCALQLKAESLSFPISAKMSKGLSELEKQDVLGGLILFHSSLGAGRKDKSRASRPAWVVLPSPCLQPDAQEQSKVKTHRSSEPVSPRGEDLFIFKQIHIHVQRSITALF